MPSIKQLKQQLQQLACESAPRQLPAFWFTDWLLHVIDKPAVALLTEDDYELTEHELAQFRDGVARMQAGTPLAYLTGQQAFWSLDFKVNEHTLIPRPDTEVLVEQVLDWIKARPTDIGHQRLLDLGTGSGCIAISLAHELKDTKHQQADGWQVVAVDLSQEALEIAQHNARINEVPCVTFIQSHWYDKLPTQDAPLFDVIVSNPPYIDIADSHLTHLMAEPISALSAPHQGMGDIIQIVQQAPSYLRTMGLLAVEHGFDQGAAVRQLFVDTGFESVHTVKDYGGNERVTLGQLASGH